MSDIEKKNIYSYDVDSGTIVTEKKGKGGKTHKELSTSKALGLAYGYMAIALAITAVFAFVACFVYDRLMVNANGNTQLQEQILYGYLGVIIFSGIGCLILAIVMAFMSRSEKHSIWVPYILYAVFMGILFSVFIIVGIEPYVIGEAFAITAVVFGVMFVLGYCTKINFTLLGWIALAFLLLAMGGVLYFGILYMLNGSVFAAEGYIWSNVIVYAVCTVLTLIVVAIDAHNIKRILSKGAHSQNIILYCAYVMYVDFIYLLIRIIYILAAAQNKN